MTKGEAIVKYLETMSTYWVNPEYNGESASMEFFLSLPWYHARPCFDKRKKDIHHPCKINIIPPHCNPSSSYDSTKCQYSYICQYWKEQDD